MSGPDHQFATLRAQREHLENITLAIRDHRHAGRSRADGGGLVCPLQPAKALLILDPRLPPILRPTAATFQKLRVDQPQNRIVSPSSARTACR